MTHTILISQTASGGAWSFNSQKFTENCFIRQVVVVAASADTTFDFYIQDADSVLVYDTRTQGNAPTGTLRDERIVPVIGINTIGVVSSTADETFTGKVIVSERVY